MLYSEQLSVISRQLMQKTSVGTQSIASAPKARTMLSGTNDSLEERKGDSHEQ